MKIKHLAACLVHFTHTVYTTCSNALMYAYNHDSHAFINNYTFVDNHAFVGTATIFDNNPQ